MATKFIKSIIIALSLLCAVESRPMSPIAVAAAPLVGGAVASALIYAYKCRNTQVTLKKAVLSYLEGFGFGITPVLNIILFSYPLAGGKIRDATDDSDKRLITDISICGFTAGLITCFYSAPEAFKMALADAGILKKVTYTTTHSKLVWA